MNMIKALLAAALVAGGCCNPASAAEPVTQPLDPTSGGKRFDVCPTCAVTELADVPWNSLRPGSVVNIFYRAEPYRTKLALRVSGSASAHIVINGVTDPSGRRPVISGDGAGTAKSNRNNGVYNDEHPEYGEALAVILIKRSSTHDPYGYKPKFLDIRNLEIRSTYGRSFVSQSGRTLPFAPWAAGIWADVVEDLVVDNCVVTDHAFGIFVNTKNGERGEDAETSRRITIRNSQIYGNGRVGSYYEHNLYVQGVGTLYEGNHIGRLRAGAEGSSLKDRSAGTIVRFNSIDCHARCLDLVQDESGPGTRRESPTTLDVNYDKAWVYGNLIKSNQSISGIHFGGDNLGDGAGPFPTYRNGPLYVFNNTFVLNSDDWRAYVFDVQHAAGKVEATNNIVYFGGRSSSRSWMNRFGSLTLTGLNWAQSGITPARDGPTEITFDQRGAVKAPGTLTPAFTLSEPLAGLPLPAYLNGFPLDRSFVAPSGTAPRSNSNVGAF